MKLIPNFDKLRVAPQGRRTWTDVLSVLDQCVRNEKALFTFGCTEAIERFLGVFYLLWAITLDVNASPYYGWMLLPLFWRILGGAFGAFRIVTGSLGGKKIRLVAAVLGSCFSATCAIGFFRAGWEAGGTGHALMTVASLWTAIRLLVRSREEGS